MRCSDFKGLKAILIDRDKTINHDHGYTYRTEELSLIAGASEGLSKFCSLGLDIYVVSNQSGIGRGYYSKDDCNKFNEEINRLGSIHGFKIKNWYICPHKPSDGCECRKPSSALIRECLTKNNLTNKEVIFIGDSDVDMICAEKIGIKNYLVKRNGKFFIEYHGKISGKFDNLYGVACFIENKLK